MIFIINQLIQLFNLHKLSTTTHKEQYIAIISKYRNTKKKKKEKNPQQLKELKEHLLDRKHPQQFIDYSFTKIF